MSDNRLDIYLHVCGNDTHEPPLSATLGGIIGLLTHLTQGQVKIMATLADVQAAVAAETTVEAGVITLLQTLSTDLTAAIAANDPVAIQAVVDSINANSTSLSAAVAANTPAAAAPVVPPVAPTP